MKAAKAEAPPAPNIEVALGAIPAALGSFIQRIPNLKGLHRTELARFFVFFLTAHSPDAAASPAQVATCFREAELTPWDDVRFYLRDTAQKERPSHVPLLVHTGTGYRLERNERERISGLLLGEPHKRETDAALRGLVGRLSITAEQSFLQEAVLCYEVTAYRAAVVMTWNLTLDHLYEYIIKHMLPDFNAALAKVSDKRVKVGIVRVKDDFGDIPEGKFIEIARSAGVISNDVRKILDQKLGTRNSYAHPSTLTLMPIKASEFIQDLVENVVLKYVV